MHVLVKSKTEEKEAFLVDVLPGFVSVDPKLIRRYYGDDAPVTAFAIHRVGRFVFKVTSGGYYVVSTTPSARRFWRFYGDKVT